MAIEYKLGKKVRGCLRERYNEALEQAAADIEAQLEEQAREQAERLDPRDYIPTLREEP